MRKRIISALLAVCLLLTVLPDLAIEAKAATPTIQGKVIDTMGRPVPASISVSAQGNTSPLATTTADESTGEFTLSRGGGFADGTYVIKAEYSICVTTTTTISLSSSDGFIIAAPITMKLAGRASGTVTDAKTGAGLSGVTVSVYTTSGSLTTSTTTGASGKYKIEIEQGSYNIEFSRSGYTTGRLERVSLGVIETTHDMQLTPGSGGDVTPDKPLPDNPTHVEIVDSGFCGKDMTWTLDENGVLNISGQGVMDNYEWHIPYGEDRYAGDPLFTKYWVSKPPWYDAYERGRVKKIVIHEGITSIGDWAFADCINLSDIDIPNDVAYIGNNAFDQCINLSKIEIPESVTVIGEDAFNYCTSLREINIPNKLTTIESGIFCSCYSLSDISLPNGVTTIGEWAFCGTNLHSVFLPEKLSVLGGHAFARCSNLATIAIPKGVSALYDRTFSGCVSLKNISLSSSLTKVDFGVFQDCGALADVFYSGTEEQWKKISIDRHYNDALTSASIHYNSTGPVNPTPSPSPKPTPGNNTKLQSLANDWETAYTSYTEAIRKKLSASAQVNLKAGSLKQLAEQFEASLGEKYGLQVATIGLTKDDRLLVYRALLKMMSEYVGSEMLTFGDISTSDLDKIPTKIVKKVANALKNTSYHYVEGSTKVNIELMDYSGAKWGSATIIKPKQLYPTTTMFSSKSTAVENILKDYTKELLDFDGALVAQAAQEAYKELLKNLFGKSIDSLTSNYINNKISKFTPQLKKLGLGDVPNGLNNCCNYYQFIKKIKSGDSSDLLSMLDGTKDISFSDPSIEDGLTKQAMKNLDRIRKEIEKAVKGEATTPESYLGKLIGGIFNFKCPVSVAVYDSTGSQVGYVGDDDLWYNDSVYIEKNGDVKTVYTNGAVSFKITGTDYGTLNCTYEEYENGAATRRINYYDIPVETGKELNATISEDGRNVILREAGGQTLSPNETVPAADYQKSTVSISVNASGGDVQGAGKYVKGDSVQLLASPQTGYRFIGWQSQDGSLIEINQLYEFTAKENASFTAVFARDATQHSFIDVTSDAWYAESVQYVYENGLMTGTSETTFSPDEVTTRGQLVTILYRMEGEPPVNNTDRFDDVPSGQWYTNAVAWAADNGIVSGYGNKKYGPHDGITREQMVTILHRYADSKKVDTSKTVSLEKYSDQNQISSYAVASMQWAVGEGIITGTSQTTLAPTGTSTRAQVAAILQRCGEKFPTAE